MKKHLSKILLAAFAVMLLSMSVLVGCGGGAPESLEGTKWVITKISEGGAEVPVAQFAEEFGVSEDKMYIEFHDNKATSNFTGVTTDYTYKDGKLIVDNIEFQVDGNTMTVDDGGVAMTLQKQ